MSSEGEKGAVVVTGAGSGIGHGLSVRLAAEGYRVAACDVEAGRLAGVNLPGLSFHRLDVRDRAELDRVVRLLAGEGRAIEGLATCAAVYKAVPFLELDEALWDQTLAINLKGSLFACQAVLPVMRRQRRGSIVLFASGIARRGAVASAHYAATKGGILGLGRSLALETAADNIRVNILSPGISDTPQPRGNMSEAELFAKAEDIPLGRIGTVEDMVEAALFLLQDESSFVTGQDIRVNGGAQLF